ncbi:hydroxypyruvate isomerase [Mycobacterium frederiksbergense]|uniref:Hydroxypyruvate isomerase n=1 Tax=Mycolicibacterium frederiksbergense TaxID=117567 RepID=A0ABT6L3Q5_9MYCO|nr:TIM barrel protein [Mycolicibacterium frederiksbergense]MDH6196640.1 hydroxypyruvate isomerase [Mycolicibacterium frederiksbergense]
MHTATSHFVVNCSILFDDLPLLQRPHAAREAGFEAVEFWWPFSDPVPRDTAVDAFVRAVTDAGVHLTALNFAGGDMAAGERGLLSDPAQRQIFRDNVDVAIGIANQLGTKAFNALYGNRRDGLDPHIQDEVAVDNLAHAGRLAHGLDAAILIEPLSGVPGYPLLTAADAIAVIDRVSNETGVAALRLLADLYHLHVNGDDVAAVIDHYVDRIGHVQIADAPGRGAPGTGGMNIAGHLAHLGIRGYRGNVSLEYRAGGTDPFGWLPPAQRRASPWTSPG